MKAAGNVPVLVSTLSAATLLPPGATALHTCMVNPLLREHKASAAHNISEFNPLNICMNKDRVANTAYIGCCDDVQINRALSHTWHQVSFAAPVIAATLLLPADTQHTRTLKLSDSDRDRHKTNQPVTVAQQLGVHHTTHTAQIHTGTHKRQKHHKQKHLFSSAALAVQTQS